MGNLLKRLSTLFVVFVMAVGLMAACSSESDSRPPSHESTQSRSQTDTQPDGEENSFSSSGRPDVDDNGCDTRNHILNRDLTDKTYEAGTNDCIVLTCVLNDPYMGKTISFQRGQDTSNAVQIDHVVALPDAWQKSAQRAGVVDYPIPMFSVAIMRMSFSLDQDANRTYVLAAIP